MEKVVYLLGAGFSAPLKIPVIKNFLMKARDLYMNDRDRYAHFGSVLGQIDQMQKTKSYYDIDLFDIEQVLSILQMEDQVTGKDRSREFSAFIAEVVRACTPQMGPHALAADSSGYLKLTNRFPTEFFGQTNDLTTAYGLFVANLINLRLEVHGVDVGGSSRYYFAAGVTPNSPIEYGVVTLNYDLVIENCVTHIYQNLQDPTRRSGEILPKLRMAKLHGSVDGDIVAPTWKKWTTEGLRDQWAYAYAMLTEANHIRIIGYSLPVSDSYIRYLLASAVMKSEHLKSIDVICLDDVPSKVAVKYREFVSFKFFRFKNGDVLNYLREGLLGPGLSYAQLHSTGAGLHEREWAEYTGLEQIHESFMSTR